MLKQLIGNRENYLKAAIDSEAKVRARARVEAICQQVLRALQIQKKQAELDAEAGAPFVILREIGAQIISAIHDLCEVQAHL